MYNKTVFKSKERKKEIILEDKGHVNKSLLANNKKGSRF